MAKGSYRLGSVIMVLVAIGMITVGINIFVGSLANQYNTTISTPYWNTTQNAYNMTEQMKESAESGQSKFTNIISPWALLWNAGKLIFNAFTSLNAILSDIASLLHLPTWAFYGITAIVIIVITAVFMNFVRGKEA